MEFIKYHFHLIEQYLLVWDRCCLYFLKSSFRDFDERRYELLTVMIFLLVLTTNPYPFSRMFLTDKCLLTDWNTSYQQDYGCLVWCRMYLPFERTSDHIQFLLGVWCSVFSFLCSVMPCPLFVCHICSNYGVVISFPKLNVHMASFVSL